MVKTSEVRSDGAEAEVASDNGPSDGTKIRRRSEQHGDGQKVGRRRGEGASGGDDEINAAEHLQQDFAKVRAKVAVDPLLAARSFSAAWTTDVIEEEDEAEFIDAVADCLGAGFSLESALTGWDNGTLAAEAGEEGTLFDDEPERDDEAPLAFSSRHRPPKGRRIIIH